MLVNPVLIKINVLKQACGGQSPCWLLSNPRVLPYHINPVMFRQKMQKSSKSNPIKKIGGSVKFFRIMLVRRCLLFFSVLH